MASIQAPSPASITKEEFDDLLARYEPLLESVSTSKPGKLDIGDVAAIVPLITMLPSTLSTQPSLTPYSQEWPKVPGRIGPVPLRRSPGSLWGR